MHLVIRSKISDRGLPIFIVCLVSVLLQHHVNGLNCQVSTDTIFGGSLVNCSFRNLSRHDLHKLHFNDATTLIVTGNKFESLPNNSFSSFVNLKHLECEQCGLVRVMTDALRGLGNLEILHLSQNDLRISDHAFTNGVFRHVPGLKKLYIDNNGNRGKAERYSDYIEIFTSLPELTELAIDSFRHLRIGEEFLNLTKLTSLKITCSYLYSFANDSLKGFHKSSINSFELSEGDIYDSDKMGLDVFDYLPNVSYLSLDTFRVGNQNALRMMKPLQGRSINTIRWNALFSPIFGNLKQKTEKEILTAEAMQYLGNICVSNFYWFHSRIRSLDDDAVTSPTWRECLRTFVIQNDELINANNVLFFKMKVLKKLELVAYLNQADGMMNEFYFNSKKNKNWIDHTQRNTSNPEKIIFPQQMLYQQGDKTVFGSDTGRYPYQTTISTETYESRSLNNNNCYSSKQNVISRDKIANLTSSYKDYKQKKGLIDLSNDSLVPCWGVLNIALPPSCKTFVADGIHYTKLNFLFRFKENQLTTLVASNGVPSLEMHGKLYGLNTLSTLNLQGTKLSFALDFFDTFPNLRNLILRKTTDNPKFLEINSKRIVENIYTLEYLDLSDNGLKRLAPQTFHTSKSLKHLCLANNKIARIPFSLKLTPSLEVLDLRGNSFVDLPALDRADLDDHIISVQNFSIFFDSNDLSCTCSDLPFIAWLNAHRTNFDKDANYTCISEDGKMSNTARYRDVEGFWRQCHGYNYFMYSLTLVCAQIALYLAVYLGMKKRTEIISNLMQLFVPDFRLKTRHDFSIDVCIGYADQDGTYVRNVLLRYLEDKWKLRTFVHQRDLCHDPLLMSKAIQSSWRCLILVSENFLDRHHMAHNIMKVASFFVSPSNPRSVVVMVEQRVRHQIPDYVLQVVDEDNIIELPQLGGPLDYEAKETLKNRLL